MTLNHPFYIGGYVYDIDGWAVSNYTIEFEAEGWGTKNITTDTDGYYQLDIQDYATEGNYVYVRGILGDWQGERRYNVTESDFSKELELNINSKIAADLKIWFYDDSSIVLDCSDWKAADKQFTIELWGRRGQIEMIKNHTRPGAVKEMYEVLGEKTYTDTTFSGENTLTFAPQSGTRLDYMRRETTGYVRSVKYEQIKGPTPYMKCHISCYVSGSQY